MMEGPYWPLAIKSLEKKICKQLSERDFMFDTLTALCQEDICNCCVNIVIIIDSLVRGRQIIYQHNLNGYGREKHVADVTTDICDAIIDRYPNRVRYRKYKVYCQHCGAPIQPNEPNCPYCGQAYVEFNFKEE